MTNPDRRTWREAPPAHRALLHEAQPAADPPVCIGSNVDREYALSDVTDTDGKGWPSYARVRCPACGRGFTTRVIRTRGGVSTGPIGIVIVPRHRAAQEG